MNHLKVLVTGGSGFLGRHVVDALKNHGADVHSCSRREGVDIRDADGFARFLANLKPDCIVHCAAHVGGLTYARDHAIDVFEDNLRIALGLLHGCAQAGLPYLLTVMPNCTYPGSKDVYREAEWWDGPLHDSVLIYGLPRKTLWGLAAAYTQQHGLCCNHMILPNLYGPHDHFDSHKSHALGAIVSKMARAQRHGDDHVTLWGTGKPIREWLYVSDAADAIVAFLRVLKSPGDKPAPAVRSQQSGHIFNVGVEQGISIRELAETIRDALRWSGQAVFDTSKPDGAAQKLMDGQQFRRLTGWQPHIPLKQGISKTVTWYRENVS